MVRIFLIVFILTQNVYALEISFSVPEIPEEINLLSPNTEVERLVLNAIAFSLFGYIESKNINKDSLIYSYSGDSSGTKFILSLKNNLQFANLNPVYLSDIIYSLNRCNFESLLSINANSNTKTIEISFKNNVRDNFIKMVSHCPILEEGNYQLFRKEFGKHTTLSSVSHYKIERFVPNKKIELSKHDFSIDLNSAPSAIYFTEYANPRKALTKLRVGSIDIFTTDNEGVVEIAKKDKTLKIINCRDNKYILRTNLKFDCNNFSNIQYIY